MILPWKRNTRRVFQPSDLSRQTRERRCGGRVAALCFVVVSCTLTTLNDRMPKLTVTLEPTRCQLYQQRQKMLELGEITRRDSTASSAVPDPRGVRPGAARAWASRGPSCKPLPLPVCFWGPCRCSWFRSWCPASGCSAGSRGSRSPVSSTLRSGFCQRSPPWCSTRRALQRSRHHHQ